MTEPARRVRTQAERDADGTTWRSDGRCGNTIQGLLGGQPLVCTLAPGHDGWHHNDNGTLWTPPGEYQAQVDIRQHAPMPPRRRWWHRYTRRNP